MPCRVHRCCLVDIRIGALGAGRMVNGGEKFSWHFAMRRNHVASEPRIKGQFGVWNGQSVRATAKTAGLRTLGRPFGTGVIRSYLDDVLGGRG